MIEYLEINIEDLFNADYIEVKKGKTYSNKTDEEKKAYREKWIKLRNNYPNSSKGFMKNIDIATYTWLSRHDKQWLSENSPLKKTYGHSKKIDWKKRDEEILRKVKEVVESMYNSLERLERVTIGAVGRKIGGVYLLQKYIRNIPKTNEYLQEKCESIEEFQKRRISYVRKKVMNNGKSEWIVKRGEGIR